MGQRLSPASNISAYASLLIDRSAPVSAIRPVMISNSEHQYVTSDGIALRATWRIGWNIVGPTWIGNCHWTLLCSWNRPSAYRNRVVP